MKIRELRGYLLLDEFPKASISNQIVIITHLYNIDKWQLPANIPKIYTTQTLADLLLLYYGEKSIGTDKETNISKDKFKIITPNKPFKIHIPNNQNAIKMCFYEGSDDDSKSNMLSISFDKHNFLYGGIVTDIRTILLNDDFVKYIQKGIILFVNVTRAKEKCHPREMRNAFDEIEKMISSDKPDTGRIEDLISNKKVHIQVKLFGYEDFIAKLAKQLPRRIYLKGLLYNIHKILTEDVSEFQRDLDKANIFISADIETMEQIEEKYQNHGIRTIKIVETTPAVAQEANESYCELQWSPLPTPFHLELLAMMVKPDKVRSINHAGVAPANVPEFIWKYERNASLRYAQRENRSKTNISPYSKEYGKPLPKSELSPTKETPQSKCLHKKAIQYQDYSDSSTSD